MIPCTHSLALLVGLAHGAPLAPDSADAGLSSSLRTAHAAWAEGPRALRTWRMARLEPPEADAVRVVVEGAEGLDPEALVAAVEAAAPGAWVEEWAALPGEAGALVQATVPYEALRDLAAVPGVLRVREPHRPRPQVVSTEGYAAMFAQDWHAEGVEGRRVDVAVLDVGFAGYNRLLGTELPDRVDFAYGTAGGTDHGTAVAEIIHDVAPRARLDFYAFGTEVEFYAALDAIGRSSADVVNGSVGFDNVWHTDGTSPITQAVDDLVAGEGIPYVAAAGNENDRYRVGALAMEANDEVSIGGMSPTWVYAPGGWVDVSFRWSDPMGASANDLDLYIYGEDGSFCGKSDDPQTGFQHPYEWVACHTGGNWAQAVVVRAGGAVDGLTGYLYAWYGLDEADWSEERNLTLPADTFLGLTVGAVDLPETGEVAWYSSRGPTDDGRDKPELVAPATVSTATYGFDGFAGTSAAAPHATGVAALVLQADKRHMEPEELVAWMVENTTDVGEPGVDGVTGAGFLTPGDIPWRGCHCATTAGGPRGVAPLLLGAGLLAGLRRRRRSRGPVLAVAAGLVAVACEPVGRDAFFVELTGRVVTEQEVGAAGAEVTVATADGALMGRAPVDETGWWALPVLVDGDWTGNALRLHAEGPGYASADAWTTVDLREGEAHTLAAHPPQTWSAWTWTMPPLRLAFDDLEGVLEGEVVDAASGVLVGSPALEEPLEIEVREGWNAPETEPVAAVVEVSSAGSFRVDGLAPGLYTGTLRPHAGLALSEARFPLFLKASETGRARVAAGRALGARELRVSLTWRGLPADLDLHFTGPKAVAQQGEQDWERFHVWSGAPTHPPNATETTTVAMERLDEDGEGPESAVAYEVRDAGRYRVSVHDVTNATDDGSEGLSFAGALVQLWLGAATPEFFELTPGVVGDGWLAGELDLETGVLYRLEDLAEVDDPGDGASF